MEQKKLHFLVAGGDMRQVRLCSLLHADGHCVSAFALERYRFNGEIKTEQNFQEAAEKADCVIFPMPMLQEGRLNAPLAAEEQKAEHLLPLIPKRCVVMAGMVPEGMMETARKDGILLHDYLKREELAVYNASATAEGAIQIAMENTAHTLCGSRCMVIGYGRIGKLLCAKLHGLGAKVVACARKHGDLAIAECSGLESCPFDKMEERLDDMDLIFNTVPAMVLPREKLMKIGSRPFVIDLASKPGGADFEKMEREGKTFCESLSNMI